MTIEEMKSVKCQQPFRFGLSKHYVSETLVELLVLVKVHKVQMVERMSWLYKLIWLMQEFPSFVGKELWRCGTSRLKVEGRLWRLSHSLTDQGRNLG